MRRCNGELRSNLPAWPQALPADSAHPASLPPLPAPRLISNLRRVACRANDILQHASQLGLADCRDGEYRGLLEGIQAAARGQEWGR